MNKQSDSMVSRYQDLLALLRAQHWLYYGSHWQSRQYDLHLLFERLYGALPAHFDGLAEKMVARFGNDSVNGAEIMSRAMKNMTNWSGSAVEAGIKSEHALQDCVKAILKDDTAISEGMQNFLQGIADDHETHLYLLGQIDRKATAETKTAMDMFQKGLLTKLAGYQPVTVEAPVRSRDLLTAMKAAQSPADKDFRGVKTTTGISGIKAVTGLRDAVTPAVMLQPKQVKTDDPVLNAVQGTTKDPIGQAVHSRMPAPFKIGAALAEAISQLDKPTPMGDEATQPPDEETPVAHTDTTSGSRIPNVPSIASQYKASSHTGAVAGGVTGAAVGGAHLNNEIRALDDATRVSQGLRGYKGPGGKARVILAALAPLLGAGVGALAGDDVQRIAKA